MDMRTFRRTASNHLVPPDNRASRAVPRFAVGVDVGGTTIKAGLVIPASGRIVHSLTVPTGTALGAAHALGQLIAAVRSVLEHPAAGQRLPLIGVAVPEMVTSDGCIASRDSLAWTSSRLKRRLGEGRTGIYSDVQAAAYAEGRFGAGRREAAFLYLSIGTGISCSLVIAGKPFQGAHGFAIAFASGRSDFPEAGLGPTLESRVGGAAILRRAREQGLDVADGAALGELALRRGPAQRLIDSAAKELAMHVAILVNALDPGALILGGGLGSARGRYFDTFAKSLPSYRYQPRGSQLKVLQAKLGPKAGIVGAACWASTVTSHGSAGR
jgi:predicted NBD/HSP70 family sugar kinase